MKAQNAIQVIFFAGLLSMIQSCGGDSDVGNKNDINSLNSGLEKSFLWSSSAGDNKRLDLSTGRWHEISVMQSWIDGNENMRNIYSLYESFTRFTNDGKFALKVIQDCDRDIGSVLSDIMAQCFVVFDLDKEIVVSEFKISPITSERIDSIALFIGDGEHIYIAILDDNTFDQYRLRIYDLDGNQIDESLYSDRLADEFVKVDSLEWLPDGRLIFSYGPVIMRSTESFSTSARALKVFGESQGEPVHLRVSPDGTQIAYALKTGGTFTSLESTLWVMDVDGNNSYQLVEALSSSPPEMNNPTWSQDGQWIGFHLGGIGGILRGSPGFPAGLFVVPSDSVKVRVDDYDTVYDMIKDPTTNVTYIHSYYRLKTNNAGVHILFDDDDLQRRFPEGRVTWVMQ